MLKHNRGLINQLLAGIAASMGGFCFGTTFSWATPILPYLTSAGSVIPLTPEEASWVISVNQITIIIASPVSAFLSNRFGRKPTILLSAPLYAIGYAIIIIFKTYPTLLIARLIHGFAAGLGLAVIPIYLGEIASTEYRGPVTSLLFTFSWIAFLVEFCTGPYMSFTSYTIMNIAYSVVFFAVFLFQPESPYYYLLKNNKEAAVKSLKWFRGLTEAEVSNELHRMIQSVEEDKSNKASWREVIATSADRKALLIFTFTNLAKLMSGSPSIVSYAANIFQLSFGQNSSSNLILIVLGIVSVITSLSGFLIFYYLPRRPVFIVSCMVACICSFIAAIFYYLMEETSVDVSTYNVVPAIAVLIQSGFLIAGIYPINTAFSSELFTSKTRSTASSIGVIVGTSATFLLLKLYQNFVDIFGVYFNFVVFGVVCIASAVIAYFYIPETKNKTFEEIRRELAS